MGQNALPLDHIARPGGELPDDGGSALSRPKNGHGVVGLSLIPLSKGPGSARPGVDIGVQPARFWDAGVVAVLWPALLPCAPRAQRNTDRRQQQREPQNRLQPLVGPHEDEHTGKAQYSSGRAGEAHICHDVCRSSVVTLSTIGEVSVCESDGQWPPQAEWVGPRSESTCSPGPPGLEHGIETT